MRPAERSRWRRSKQSTCSGTTQWCSLPSVCRSGCANRPPAPASAAERPSSDGKQGPGDGSAQRAAEPQRTALPHHTTAPRVPRAPKPQREPTSPVTESEAARIAAKHSSNTPVVGPDVIRSARCRVAAHRSPTTADVSITAPVGLSWPVKTGYALMFLARLITEEPAHRSHRGRGRNQRVGYPDVPCPGSPCRDSPTRDEWRASVASLALCFGAA